MPRPMSKVSFVKSLRLEGKNIVVTIPIDVVEALYLEDGDIVQIDMKILKKTQKPMVEKPKATVTAKE